MAITQPTLTPEAAAPRRNWQLPVLLGPAAFWLFWFFLVPLVVILIYSFLTRSATGGVDWIFTFDNYARLLSDPIYVTILGRSVWIGGVATLICLLIAYPLALFIILQPAQWRSFYIFLVLIPFWTNMLVRTYAWMTILNNNGLINSFVTGLGGPRLTLINTEGAVLLGLVYGQLPFMVLPLYAAMDRFDFRMMEAASDLGANKWRSFLRVMLPMTAPGIAAGSVLVFILSAGNYIIPALLGGNKVTMIGNQLELWFRTAQNQPLGSAAAVLLMIMMVGGVIIYFRTTTEDDR
jgi:spermidine/putrescine transport system permease protein